MVKAMRGLSDDGSTSTAYVGRLFSALAGRKIIRFNRAGCRVEQLHRGLHHTVVATVVEDGGTYGGLVALTQEAWQIGLNHHRLAAYTLGSIRRSARIVAPGKALERPAADSVGHSEHDVDIALGIGCKTGFPQHARLNQVPRC